MDPRVFPSAFVMLLSIVMETVDASNKFVLFVKSIFVGIEFR
jgi:hypothetical protein